MKVYLLGTHSASNTNGKVIITVELLPKHTDMNGILLCRGKLINPFYRQLKVNAGKIVNITDLVEENDFTTSTINVQGEKCHITVGKYFYTTDADAYLIAYQYKLAVLEEAEYVASDYTGVSWSHYHSGHISKKMYYKSGILHSRFYYRDDAFNTLEGVRLYRNGVVECEFTYNNREALIRQRWYDTKGKVYHKITASDSSIDTDSESGPDFEPEPEPVTVPDPPPCQKDDGSDDDEPDQGIRYRA